MTMNKISFEKSELAAILLAVILVKLAIYYYPMMESYFAGNVYNAVTTEFEERTVKQLQENDGSQSETSVYYIGRSSCIDCRESIGNTKKLLKLLSEEYHTNMYYVKLKNNISQSEREYLDSIKVDNIPTIIAFRGNKVYQFKYDKIIANDFENRFRQFVEKVNH